MMKSKPIQNKMLVFVGVAFFLTVQGIACADKSNLIEDDLSGIYKKVIVKRDGVKLHSERDGGTTEPIESKAVQFKIKTPAQKESDNGWIRVGGEDGEPRGWLKEEDVIEWNTRYLARPNLPNGNSSFTIKSQDGNVYIYAGAGKGNLALCPILSTTKEEKNPVYNCAFMNVTANDGDGAVAPRSPEAVDVPLDIVFVIDTTSSMTPLINAAKEVTKSAANRLAGAGGKVRNAVKFGLVEYRDIEPGITFPGGKPAQVVTPLTDIKTFQDKLANLQVTELSSDDWNEDVLAGLKMALEDLNWGKKSSKHIILLGDALHSEGPKNTTGWDIATAITSAKGSKEGEGGKLRGSKLFHAVMGKHNQAADDDITRVTEEQFRQLAQNGGRFEGVFMTFDATPGGKERVINDLGGELSDAIGGLTGPLQPTPPNGKGGGKIAKAIWDIRKSEEGAPIPPVDSGTAKVRDAAGNKLAELEAMVSRDALERLASTMNLLILQMKQMSDPAKRKDVGAFLNALKMSVFIGTAGQKLTPDTPLETALKGLPLETDILQVTVKAIAQKNEESFNDWLKNLESSKKRADVLIDRDKDQWHEISGAAENAKYTYVALQDLP